jgi:hypothetical protein
MSYLQDWLLLFFLVNNLMIIGMCYRLFESWLFTVWRLSSVGTVPSSHVRKRIRDVLTAPESSATAPLIVEPAVPLSAQTAHIPGFQGK